MSRTTLIGLILILLSIFVATGFVFSKIVIQPVFTSGFTGTDALKQGVNLHPMSLLDIIISPISNFFDSINPFHIKLF